MKRICLFLIIASGIIGTAHAQQQDVQSWFDPDGKIDVIDARLEDTLQVFSDRPDFVEARLFLRNDSTYSLEITQRVDGRLQRSVVRMTQAEVDRLRSRIATALARSAPSLSLDQRGRGRFLTTTTALGLAYYGWAVPVMLESENTAAGSLYLLTASASFLIPYIATTNTRVTDGQAVFAGQGGVRGIADGMLLYWALHGSEFSSMDGRAMLLAGTLGSVSEMIIGYNIAGNSDMSSGRASTISVLGNFGLGIGLGTYYTVDREGSSLAPVAGLLASAAGYWVGDALSRSKHYTDGDATALATTATLGAAIPPALMTLSESHNSELYTGSAVLGSMAGIWIGHSLLATRDLTSSQGTLVSLGALTGALFGGAVGYLATQHADDHTTEKTTLTLGSLGAIGGFALVFSSLDIPVIKDERTSSLRLSFSPAGLLTAIGPMQGKTDRPVPLLSLSTTL